jgi:hypothetical protein
MIAPFGDSSHIWREFYLAWVEFMDKTCRDRESSDQLDVILG